MILRKLLVISLAVAGFLTAIVSPASATTFADVPTGHWAYPAVQYVTARSWITPYSNGFHPDQL
ncbi:MAG: S-layer homology domain-containing protein, partial [Actinobacteria bacterium]